MRDILPFWKRMLPLTALLASLTACADRTEAPAPSMSELATTTATLTTAPPPGVTPSLTPFQPSPTPPPLAAWVNGEGITLDAYEAEAARLLAVLPDGAELAPEHEQAALDELINQTLLAQAAAQQGFELDDALLEERLARLKEHAGGQEAFNRWMAENGYMEATFRHDLARAIAAAWMRDRVIADVPESAPHVHARQILLKDAEEARQILVQLRNGAEFDRLARENDPVTGGELGWFPQGYLPYPAVEGAAFALEEGQISDVIETPSGYHIILLVERDEDRPLSADALLEAQRTALQAWLEIIRDQSEIEILLP